MVDQYIRPGDERHEAEKQNGGDDPSVLMQMQLGTPSFHTLAPSRNPKTGLVAVPTPGTAVQFSTGAACMRVLVRPDTGNGGVVCIGASDVDSTVAASYYPVHAAHPPFWLNVDNVKRLWLDAFNAGDKVYWIAI
jgi:hypothetical protein